MRTSNREKEEIQSYAEGQHGEDVIHLEKSASEMVGPVRHDIWDVHCADSRWWVVTNPTNYYSKEDSRAVRSSSPSTSGLSARGGPIPP